MRRGRRWLALLLAVVIAVGLLPAAAGASGDNNQGTEVVEEGTETTTNTLSDGTAVTAESDVTRAQLAELIYDNDLLKTKIDLAAHGNEGTVPFTDLDGTNGEDGCTDEQKTAITALYNAQMISGTSATEFSPDDEVCRGDAMLIIWRADGARSNTEPMTNPFKNADGSEEQILPHWLPVATCFYAAGLISGEGNSGNGPTFNGGGDLSVHEAYQFISRFNDENTYYRTFLENTESGATTRAAMTVEFYNEFQAQLSSLPVASGREWSGNGPFNDISGCTEEQVTAIRFFYERGIISGTTTTTFTPYGPVSNLHLATLLQNCATASTETASGTQSVSLLSAMPLSEGQNELDAAFQFLIDNGANEASVEAAGNNENAPALTSDLTIWINDLAPDQPTIDISDDGTVTITAGSTAEDDGTVIYYTTEGSDPSSAESEHRQRYSAPFRLTNDATVKAVAVKNNLTSTVATAAYTVPKFTLTARSTSLPGGGTVNFTVTNIPTDAVVSVTCSDSNIAVSGSGTTWTASLPNADATYTFTATAGSETATCQVSVTYKSTSSGNSGGTSGNSSNTTTTTERNPDGSTTTTTTNRTTGTVTETTRYPDGSREVVETKRDGTVTTTTTDTDGNETAVVENPDGTREVRVEQADGTSASAVADQAGRIQAEVSLSSRAVSAAQKDGEAVTLPIPNIPISGSSEDASLVEIDLPRSAGAVKVEIPTEDAGPGTVAVIVNEDGTETVVKKSVALDGGLTLTLETGATVKIVDNRKDFDDTYDHWAEDAIAFATAHEMFGGTSADTFSPDTPMTRGMLAVVLHRFEDTPNHAFTGSFEDVVPGSWYADGIHWMAENGIIGGYGNGNFGADDSITREQLAAILYRYAGVMGYGTSGSASLDRFSDVDSVSGYAVEAMGWAVGNGLIGGMGDGPLAPQGNATRAQVATILMRFVENLAQ